MLQNGIRSDLFNIAERVCSWDLKMHEHGFDSGCSYKRFLLDFGRIDSTLESRYDLLTVEGWKEIFSERIAWENLPDHFDCRSISRPYRSSCLNDVHARIDSIASLYDLADIRSERWLLTFPYQGLIDRIRKHRLDVDEAFRDGLVANADSEALILAAQNVGVNPLDVPVRFKEVKNIVREFCQSKGLARLSSVRPSKYGFVYGHELPNDLVLCLLVLEVRSFDVEGRIFFRINTSFNLVRKDQFLTSWGWPKDFPWAGLPELSLYPSYGLKDSSSIAFYVNLAYILLSFQFWCEAFDGFFES